jgi:hypothetical protein
MLAAALEAGRQAAQQTFADPTFHDHERSLS